MDEQFISINNLYLKQDLPIEECSAEILQQCKEIARAYAINENAIVTLGDNIPPGRCYGFFGGLADVLGLHKEERVEVIPSLYEYYVFNRANRDDLMMRHAHELAYVNVTKHLSVEQRRNYYLEDSMRVRDKDGVRRLIRHRLYAMAGTSGGGYWLNMCVYTICPDDCIIPKIVNTLTGECRILTNEDYKGILSKREIELLHLINKGLLSKEIAAHLCISINTVHRHRQNILSKLKVDNAIEACRMARNMGLLT